VDLDPLDRDCFRAFDQRRNFSLDLCRSWNGKRQERGSG